MGDEYIETHPIQTPYHRIEKACCPKVVTMAAYEVYCHLYGEQSAMVTGSCRGGFHVNELIPLLYARSFPKEEWRKREQEAIKGLNL